MSKQTMAHAQQHMNADVLPAMQHKVDGSQMYAYYGQGQRLPCSKSWGVSDTDKVDTFVMICNVPRFADVRLLVFRCSHGCIHDRTPTDAHDPDVRVMLEHCLADGTFCMMQPMTLTELDVHPTFRKSKPGRVHRCYHCNFPTDAMCSRCRLVYFCSSACQKKAYSSHRETCRLILDVDTLPTMKERAQSLDAIDVSQTDLLLSTVD